MLKVTIQDNTLAQLADSLSHAKREPLMRGASITLCVDVQKYMRQQAQAHHLSAHRLNATPTGHLEHAADSVRAAYTANAAMVNIYSPGFGRVFAPITIRPKRAAALTIPIAKESYGTRAAELRARGWKLFCASPQKGVLFGTNPVSKKTKPLYALKKSTTLPRDRTLLPTHEKMSLSVSRGIQNTLDAIHRGRI